MRWANLTQNNQSCIIYIYIKTQETDIERETDVQRERERRIVKCRRREKNRDWEGHFDDLHAIWYFCFRENVSLSFDKTLPPPIYMHTYYTYIYRHSKIIVSLVFRNRPTMTTHMLGVYFRVHRSVGCPPRSLRLPWAIEPFEGRVKFLEQQSLQNPVRSQTTSTFNF